MKTLISIEDMIEAAKLQANKSGAPLVKKLEDCEDAPLALHLPSVEFVRAWPDSAIQRLIDHAGKHVLQHDFSRMNRAAYATLDDKDPAKRKEMVEVATLADFCKPKGMSKADAKRLKEIVEKAEAMLDAVQKGGESVWPAFAKNAKGYGLKDFPAKWEDLTRDVCIKYQAAKRQAMESDLA